MMNGLKKCFCYGKLLKQLFITLLISCSILLVGSSVSAFDGYVPFGSTLNFGGNNCNFGNNLSFNCQKGGITLSNFGENHISSLFWLNNGIGFYYSPNPSSLYQSVKQGYINTGFYVCYGDTQTIIDNNWVPSCPSPSANCVYGFTPSGLMDYNSLVSLLTSEVPLYAYNPDGSNGVLYSLLYDDFYFSVYNSFTSYNVCGTFKNGVVEENIGITGNSLSNFRYGNNVLSSPIGSTGIPYPVNSGNSDLEFVENVRAYYNGFVYSGFLRYGYYTGLCYSNFNIDTLGVPASGGVNSYSIFNQFFDYDKDDGFYDTGATVLDLKDYYFSGLSDDLWIKNIINIWSSSYNRFNIDWYIGKPRGFWSIPYNINNYIDNSDSPFIFNGGDYMCFCRMSLEGFDSDGLNSCSLSITFKDYIEDNADVIIKGIDNPANITNVFEGFDRLVSVIMNYKANVPNGISGILPTYIIFGFFLFLLLYGLKR